MLIFSLPIACVQVFIHLSFYHILSADRNTFLISDLPSQPVDLVIDTISSIENNSKQNEYLPEVIEWANRNKAPVLALDPCIRYPRPSKIMVVPF